MCSVEETDFGGDDPAIACMTPSSIDSKIVLETIPNELCKKCSNANVTIKIGLKDAQCTECFLKSVRHKFRATLGASKCVPRGASVLVVYDGGPASTVLLDVVNNAIADSTFKRIHLTPSVLFVDESGLLNADKSTHSLLATLRTQLKSYNLPTYYTSLQHDFVTELTEDFTPKPNGDTMSAIRTICDQITDPSSRQEFVQIARDNCIRKAAKHLRCNFAFVADIGPDLATAFLTNVVLGRGSAVAHDVSLVDTRTVDMQIVRPIRDLNHKEVEMYIKLSGITCAAPAATDIEARPIGGSVQALTKSFVDGLQSNFSSTVSTVFKTGDKMNSAINEHSSANVCCEFCHSTVDDESGSTTLAAIDYSRYVSLNSGRIDVTAPNISETIQSECGRVSTTTTTTTAPLCHSCRTIFRSLTSNVLDEFLL